MKRLLMLVLLPLSIYASAYSNAHDFFKKNKQYMVYIDVDNLSKNKIDISTRDNVLIVRGKSEVNDKNTSQSSSFYQTFSLPNDADMKNITAKQDDNLLIVKIPKIKLNKNTRKIKIK
ncbi:Small heat shock protein [hydrothermal vent metagenome]|uniref:Small heat shock protein n=1 Tax=hydrothermal vent metagenome TaxID=652676 RepID=A0A1W1CLJ5_9ZZZZ